MSHPASRRDGFTSSFGVLAATLGSAVGLGNIWKFPYLTGANGGAKEMFGKNAEDVFVEVPLGTMVYDNKTGELLAEAADEIIYE